ncbi:YihY/virulence factor BrkB family protein [Sphingorhabdus arenilitoris]|uniref:YihY/virulence factor BrkB family protein n=1 Tax=Sphingorhabdus arenilitoris TaxID=1490041 RepID=A0ABV8RDL1_9SPHN
MSDHSPLSPTARARAASSLDSAVHGGSEAAWFSHLGKRAQSYEIVKRVIVGVYSDGFIHAGNFAYLSLVALFAFCIVAAAVAGALGQTQSGMELIEAFFRTVPPSAAEALRGPVENAMQARSGPLLWLSAAVGLWTTASLMEAFRDVLNRAYGTEGQRHFWQYRLVSLAAIIVGVLLSMFAFSAQFIVLTLEDLVYQYLPVAQTASAYFAWGRIIPFFALFLAIYVVFRGLTPRRYRPRHFPKWPGAALVSLWWLGCTSLLPIFVSQMANYDLTYGSLAGVMIALIFFYLIGLGMVTGAQLNAALANATETARQNGDKNIDA